MNSDQPAQADFDAKVFLQTLTQRAGVYKMLDADAKVIYVGKAKNLKKRVTSYFRGNGATPKQRAMVSNIASMEVTVTHTEGEALLLESQFIKRYKPRYNIYLRDDKSYPYIYVSSQQTFPRLSFHRGAKSKQGRYFGPYPSAGAVRESLKQLKRIFPVRQCEDSYYRNRSRPCLQYQINRCTAPCVGLVSAEDYQQDVKHTNMFLEGRGSRLIDDLVRRMENASQNREFEKAARYRDQIAVLRPVLEKHYVSGERGDLDIIACASKAGVACVQIFCIRKGQHLGDKSLFPRMPEDQDAGAVLEAFIPQYYLGKSIPQRLLISHELRNPDLLSHALADQAGHRVQISMRVRGDRLQWLKMAQTNAENGLNSRLSNQRNLHARFFSLQEELGCAIQPRRLECFDISHLRGDQTVASCVVFDPEGPVKSEYRRFNIEGITPGDDYAALSQAVTRRFARIKKGEYKKPDVLFIDGGKGQVSAVDNALDEIGVDDVMIIGVAKGLDRKPGLESMFVAGDNQPLPLSPDSPAMLLIQHMRDEAHRFAITGHRQRRGNAKKRSILETVTGLGPKRRRNLLKQFGGLREVQKAGIDALSRVDGISVQLAQRIYDTFHRHDL